MIVAALGDSTGIGLLTRASAALAQAGIAVARGDSVEGCRMADAAYKNAQAVMQSTDEDTAFHKSAKRIATSAAHILTVQQCDASWRALVIR